MRGYGKGCAAKHSPELKKGVKQGYNDGRREKGGVMDFPVGLSFETPKWFFTFGWQV